jgi:hypothetical protein
LIKRNNARTDPGVLPRLSLHAYLIYLTETGQAVCADGLWRLLPTG